MGLPSFTRTSLKTVKVAASEREIAPRWDLRWLPPAGPHFLRTAQMLGDTESGWSDEEQRFIYGPQLAELYDQALTTPGFELEVEYKRQFFPVRFVPGHVWGQHAKLLARGEYAPVDGPHPADVLVIGKFPWLDEMELMRNFVGESGRILDEALRSVGIKDFPRWYVTNICRFMPPMKGKDIKKPWVQDCRPLWAQELRIVQPKYIVCLGADALKFVRDDDTIGINAADGRVFDIPYLCGDDPEVPVQKTAKMMGVLHPVNAANDLSARRTIAQSFVRFDLMRQGEDWAVEQGIDHRAVTSFQELLDLLIEAENDPAKEDDWIAMDAEWQGEHPQDKGAYLRTVQFAWREKHAAAVVLRKAGGAPNFNDGKDMPRAMRLLTAFIKGGRFGRHRFRKKRVCGHFFTSDLEWLIPAGLDVREEFTVPLFDLDLREAPPELRRIYGKRKRPIVPAWERTRLEGGADTSAMFHAVEEAAVYKLEALVMRFVPEAPRYDAELRDWLKARKLTDEKAEGYGEVPDEILVPYGCYDADCTLRLLYRFREQLDCDNEGNCCREPFWETMIAMPAALEMTMTGVELDVERITELSAVFIAARDAVEGRLRDWAQWPELNLRSVQEVKELLYGERLNGKSEKFDEPIRLRPEGARSLELTPLVDTSKPPKPWSKIVDDGEEALHSPSTGKTTLSIMLHELEGEAAKAVGMLRDHRFLDQAVKTVLRPPTLDGKGAYVLDDDGNQVFERGLAAARCGDGRVRTHVYQTLETRRWATARPNLQNLSKNRDRDYKRMLGDLYKHKIRSVIRASAGHCLVEVDIIGAELLAMALLSGDEQMMKHAFRNQLPENHPEYYDIHSNVTVVAFRLDCEPTKKGLERIGMSHLRNIAKAVSFGVAYGRGSKAIAFGAREEGVNISVEEAQAVIDGLFSLYPRLQPFFAACEERVSEPGFLFNCWGGIRRFPPTADRKTLGDFQRQAKNFPIQSFVAGLVDRALAYLYDWRERNQAHDAFKFVLQIHDAVLLEVPYSNVRMVCEELLPWALRDAVPIYPTDLDGFATGTGPFFVGIEGGPMFRWGEHLIEAEGKLVGLPEPSYARPGVSIKYWETPSKT